MIPKTFFYAFSGRVTAFVLILLLIACKEQQPPSVGHNNSDTLTGYWYNTPLRIVQTVLREKDAANYDTEAVVKYLKDNHANVLVINAGGIVDFFQNPLPAANINPFLEGRDLLGDIVEACHAENINVIARIDFRGVEKHVYEQHPDWFGVDYQGNPNTLNYTTPELYAPCYLSYYRNEHAEKFISYLFETYDIDGIWHNSVHVHDMCWCDRCQADYKEKRNKPIPPPDASETLMDEYYEWKAGVAEEHLTRMRKTVKKYGEEKAYSAEVFGMFDVELPIHSGIDLYSGARYFDFLLSVGFLSNNTTHIEYKNLSYPAGHIRFLKSLQPEKQAVILFGTNGTSHRYIADPTEDLKIWMWETISSGGGLWNCNFTGMYPAKTRDTRNAYLTVKPFAYMEKHQNILQDQQPYAPVKILYSKTTRTHFGDEDPLKDDFGSPITGMEKVLQEAHLPYGFIPDYKLNAVELSGCELLILPNVACISDKEAGIIRNYVKNGGNILATHATSLYDENGRQRKDFALAGLFGCSYAGKNHDTRKDAYQFIINRNELVEGFNNTTMVMNGANTLQCKQTDPTAIPLTQLVPKLNNQPPEKAWKDTLPIESPVLIANTIDKGKVVYFANQPDKLSVTMGHNDFRALLKNAIGYLQPQPLITTNAPQSVHINVTQNKTKRCFIIGLINTTSAPERPLREILPVYDVDVKVNLPEEMKITGHGMLTGSTEVLIDTEQKNVLRLKFKKLEEFESVVIFYDKKNPS